MSRPFLKHDVRHQGSTCWVLKQMTDYDRTSAFIVGFTVFLSNCVDYSSHKDNHSLSHILIPNCTTK